MDLDTCPQLDSLQKMNPFKRPFCQDLRRFENKVSQQFLRHALLVLVVLVLCPSETSAAPSRSRFILITAPGPIGTLTVAEDGNTVYTDWKVDDNGRGPKIKEHIETDCPSAGTSKGRQSSVDP